MVESLVTHSTVDPELPSYEHRVLKAIREELERNHDCWDYLRNRADVYLPRESRSTPLILFFYQRNKFLVGLEG